MIRKLISSMAISSTLFLCSSAQQTPDQKLFQLIGPVQTVRIELAKFSKDNDKRVEAQRSVVSVLKFDGNGFLVESVPRRDTEPLLGPKGPLTKELLSYLYLDKSTHQIKRNRDEISIHKADGSFSTYDVKDNEVMVTSYNPDGSLYSKGIYKYDNNGNLMEESLYTSANTLLSKNRYTYEYDGNGNWIKRVKSNWIKEANESRYEPEEATYRRITYY